MCAEHIKDEFGSSLCEIESPWGVFIAGINCIECSSSPDRIMHSVVRKANRFQKGIIPWLDFT